MTTAAQKLEAKIAQQSTEALIEIAKTLNLKTDTDEITVSVYVERELGKRMSGDEFFALLDELDAELEAA